MKPKPFWLLVTGSRDWPWNDRHWVFMYLDAAFAKCLQADRELIVMHGDCPTGVDSYADDWCEESGVLVERYPADWNRYGKSAGFKRNEYMVSTLPNLCLALIKDNSPGATHCAKAAVTAGITTVKYRWEIIQ